MNNKTRNMILVSLFTALTAVGAFIKFPIGTVSISLQFVFTALAAILLGARLGALSQIIYVFLGLIGIPIFTEGGGLSYIFKPSFGYLIGFILGAYIIGLIVSKYKNPDPIKIFLACIIGAIVIYAVGVPYLYLILKNVNGVNITFYKALKIGALVFIPGDIIKCIFISIIGAKVIPALKKY
ncbi:MAG: biotin transporter BioY [Solirubrobacterales bacterium]